MDAVLGGSGPSDTGAAVTWSAAGLASPADQRDAGRSRRVSDLGFGGRGQAATSGALDRIVASSGAWTTLLQAGSELPAMPALVEDTSAAVAEGWVVVGTSRRSLVGLRGVDR